MNLPTQPLPNSNIHLQQAIKKLEIKVQGMEMEIKEMREDIAKILKPPARRA